MIDPAQIPPEAKAAGAMAIKAWLDYTLDKDTRASELTDGEHAELACAALTAALSAWPNATIDMLDGQNEPGDDTFLILPLTQGGW